MPGQDLDRNIAPQVWVVRAIHLAHSAGAKPRDDLVCADKLTVGDHARFAPTRRIFDRGRGEEF
jgi:hypothetical protein